MWLPDIALFHALYASPQSSGWVLTLAHFASDILPALMVSVALLLLVPARGRPGPQRANAGRAARYF